MINRLFVLVFTVLFCNTLHPQVVNDIFINEIQPGVWQIDHHYPWPANSIIVDCGDSNFVWIDTPYTEDATKDVLFWTKIKFGDIKLTQINTGFHIDNLGGNAALFERGIPVYGSDLTAQLVDERGDDTQKQILDWLKGPKNKRFRVTYENAKFSKPDNLFIINEGLSLTIGKEKIEVWFPGPTHSPDNVVVWFPDRKLLFGGCMVKEVSAKTPGFTGDAVMGKWAPSLRKLLSRYPEMQIVVPGHGKPGGKELIYHTIQLLQKY